MMAFFFPGILSRKQYALHWFVLFALLCLAFGLFVAALIKGAVYVLCTLLLWLYWIFGLAIPQLRSAGKPPFFALLGAVPYINLVMLVYLFAVPDKPISSATSP